jgi:hypothetical protein
MFPPSPADGGDGARVQAGEKGDLAGSPARRRQEQAQSPLDDARRCRVVAELFEPS